MFVVLSALNIYNYSDLFSYLKQIFDFILNSVLTVLFFFSLNNLIN